MNEIKFEQLPTPIKNKFALDHGICYVFPNSNKYIMVYESHIKLILQNEEEIIIYEEHYATLGKITIELATFKPIFGQEIYAHHSNSYVESITYNKKQNACDIKIKNIPIVKTTNYENLVRVGNTIYVTDMLNANSKPYKNINSPNFVDIFFV